MRLFLCLAGVVIAVWMATPLVMAYLVPIAAHRGPTGDLFGSVNALFSGLAFAGLISTLRLQLTQLDLQREELKLQREELSAQRKEMAASRGELANQVAVQRAQFKISCAQVIAAAQQIKAEAIKSKSSVDGPHETSSRLSAISQHLADLAHDIEQRAQKEMDQATSAG